MQRPVRSSAWLRAFALGVLGIASLWLYDIADRPRAHSAYLYEKGGLPRTLQVMLTDALGTRGVIAIALVLAIALGSPALSHLRPAKRLLALAILAVIGLVVGIHHRGSRPRAGGIDERPNVILLVVPNLRADRLDPRVMPHTARLATRATSFERAYVASLDERASFLTSLTGLSPHHHEVRSTLSKEERAFPPLPQRFSEAGWATALVSDHGDALMGDIDRSFDSIEKGPFEPSGLAASLVSKLHPQAETLDPSEVTLRALRAIDARRDRPFFLTLSYGALRSPMALPSPWYGLHTRPAYRGRYKYAHSEIANILGHGEPPDEEDIEQLRGLYDGAASAVDAEIDRLYAELSRRGLAETTIIVITSTQGMSLGEGGRGIGQRDRLLGDETTHVPLLILDPRRPGPRNVSAIVSNLDLAPTLASLAGLEPLHDLPGRSLLPAIEGAPLDPALAFAEAAPSGPDAATMKHRMVRDDRHKLVYAPTRKGPGWFLFDTWRDPRELDDLSAALPDVRDRLQNALWPWMLEDRSLEREREFLVPRRQRRGRAAAIANRQSLLEAKAIAFRLVDLLASADYDAEALDSALEARHADSFRTSSPYVGPAGGLGRAVAQLALRDPSGDIAQREAILAPAPASIRYSLTLPERSSLVTHIATIGDIHERVVFEVAIHEPRRGRSLLARHELSKEAAGRWHDVVVDLSAHAGRPIELELSTSAKDERDFGALALFGSPVVVAENTKTLPWNLVWLNTSDADIHGLAARGASFPRAHSTGAWARPALLGSLSGMLSSELSITTSQLAIPAPERRELRSSDPPFLPLLLRPYGVMTHAIVSLPYLLPHAEAGIDAGFESVDALASSKRANDDIAERAEVFLDAHAESRFALYLQAPTSPRDGSALPIVDRISKKLDELHLREKTLFIALGDPVYPFDSASIDGAPIPLVMSLPGTIAEGVRIETPAATTDLLPTVLALAGIPIPEAMSGRSLLPWIRDPKAPDDHRPIVIEGRNERALRLGRYRYIERASSAKSRVAEELHLLDGEEGRRTNLLSREPELGRRMREVLACMLVRSRTEDAGASEALAASRQRRLPQASSTIRLRFVGAGERRRISGTIAIIAEEGALAPELAAKPVGIPAEALRRTARGIELALSTVPDEAVGLDLESTEPTAKIAWELYLDDQPLPKVHMFGGSLGLMAEELAGGMTTARAREMAEGASEPSIDARRELGLFVVHERVEKRKGVDCGLLVEGFVTTEK